MLLSYTKFGLAREANQFAKRLPSVDQEVWAIEITLPPQVMVVSVM
jgi:hypothetical protein